MNEQGTVLDIEELEAEIAELCKEVKERGINYMDRHGWCTPESSDMGPQERRMAMIGHLKGLLMSAD